VRTFNFVAHPHATRAQNAAIVIQSEAFMGHIHRQGRRAVGKRTWVTPCDLA